MLCSVVTPRHKLYKSIHFRIRFHLDPIHSIPYSMPSSLLYYILHGLGIGIESVQINTIVLILNHHLISDSLDSPLIGSPWFILLTFFFLLPLLLFLSHFIFCASSTLDLAGCSFFLEALLLLEELLFSPCSNCPKPQTYFLFSSFSCLTPPFLPHPPSFILLFLLNTFFFLLLLLLSVPFSGLNYEYKAVNLLKGEQFSPGNFDFFFLHFLNFFLRITFILLE